MGIAEAACLTFQGGPSRLGPGVFPRLNEGFLISALVTLFEVGGSGSTIIIGIAGTLGCSTGWENVFKNINVSLITTL